MSTGTFYRKSLIALIALIEAEGITMLTPAMQEGDTMLKEMLKERQAAMMIVEKLRNAISVTNTASELAEGQWWNPGQICDLTHAFTESTLEPGLDSSVSPF